MKKTVLVTLDVELEDKDYIKDLKDYIETVLENQLETDASADLVEDWKLNVKDFVEKICYIEDCNGGYYCYEKDKEYFLNERFKGYGGVVCGIGTEEEIEKEFGTINYIQERN
jgi:hypothetical protein